jgi:hypothetical protein
MAARMKKNNEEKNMIQKQSEERALQELQPEASIYTLAPI